MDLGKYGFFFLLLVILTFIFMIFFNILPQWFLQIGERHDLVLVLSAIIIFYSLKIRKEFGRIIGGAFIYIIIGAGFLLVVHTFLLLAHTYKILEPIASGMASVEHLLFYLVLFSFIYAFHRMLKNIKP